MSEQDSTWAIVELFGHKTVAGQVTKDTSLFPLLRIDVPATSEYPKFTAEYGASAIYGITYVSEDIACRMAQSLKVNPITVYAPDLVTREQFEKMQDEYRKRISELRALPSPSGLSESRSFSDEDKDEDESGQQYDRDIPF